MDAPWPISLSPSSNIGILTAYIPFTTVHALSLLDFCSLLCIISPFQPRLSPGCSATITTKYHPDTQPGCAAAVTVPYLSSLSHVLLAIRSISLYDDPSSI